MFNSALNINIIIVNHITHLKESSSTWKTRVVFGGIKPPTPSLPYANYGGHVRIAFSPILIFEIP